MKSAVKTQKLQKIGANAQVVKEKVADIPQVDKVEEAKRILREAEEQRLEKLKDINSKINEILEQNQCNISAQITAEAWLEIGKKFFEGEKVIHIQPTLFLK